jgi:hypothetical protein
MRPAVQSNVQANRSLGGLCGGIFLDESFDQHMSGWVEAKDWKAVSERYKQEWRLERWENGLKRRFTGADQPWPIPMPRTFAPQRIRIRNPLRRTKKTKRPEIRENTMQLQRLFNIFQV